MTRTLPGGLLSLIAALALAACSPSGGLKLPGKPLGFDKSRLEAGVDDRFGGVGTCVIIADTKSGAEVYRYNSNGVCMRRLPPCATYEIANDLIGLDAGAVGPNSVLRWDKTPQPVSSWQQDSDLRTAFKESMAWWDAKVATTVGAQALKARLKAFGYGDKAAERPLNSFWQGPAQGGGLAISTREQASFLHRLYAGKLPVQPANLDFMKSVMVDEIRSGSTMSGKSGSCPSVADGSRQVAWWVGRLETPQHDWVFAASMEGGNENALPGIEIQERVKSVFADAGLWPAGA